MSALMKKEKREDLFIQNIFFIEDNKTEWREIYNVKTKKGKTMPPVVLLHYILGSTKGN